jgi:hypothetical protein
MTTKLRRELGSPRDDWTTEHSALETYEFGLGSMLTLT